MRTKIIAAAILLASLSSAFAQTGATKPKATLNTETSQQIPDNTSGAVTPANVRQVFVDSIASFQQAPQVNAQTGTSYTFLATDYGNLVTFNNSSPVAVTLPQATGSFSPWNVYVRNLGAGTVTITPTTSTINGASSLAIPQGGGVQIVSDGTNYQVSSATTSSASVTGAMIASGTVTGSNIASNTVSNSNLANMAANTVKCNNTGSPAAPIDCTQSQLAAMALPIAAFDTLCNPTSSSAAPIACQNGILHSKDMGATGNGSTDDTTTLQNWINACQTNGLICFLDQGTYKITSALSVTSAIHIQGIGYQQAGSVASILQPATTISGINAVTTQPVIIHDIGVNYASAANTGTSAIILTASGAANINTGSRLDRINIQNAFNGFNVGQAQYWTISNCLIQGIPTNGTGMTMDNSALTNPDQGDSTFTGCTITLPAAAASGINISSFAGLRVVNNKIIAAGTGGTGIALNLKNGITSSLLTVIGNSIEGISNGILLQRAGTTGSFTNVIIANNEFEPGAGNAAVNDPTDANGVWLNNVMISGNIIFGPTTSTSSFGYIVKSANGVQISNNLTISNSSTNGFQAVATTGSSNCTIGPNGRGAGLFVAIDAGCTAETTVTPGG